jgi:hypothetical protein
VILFVSPSLQQSLDALGRPRIFLSGIDQSQLPSISIFCGSLATGDDLPRCGVIVVASKTASRSQCRGQSLSNHWRVDPKNFRLDRLLSADYHRGI